MGVQLATRVMFDPASPPAEDLAARGRIVGRTTATKHQEGSRSHGR
jgi:hypothetical protein